MKFKDSFHPYAIITILFWSLAYVFTRLALTYFSAFSLGFLRYFTASCALIVIVLIIKLKLPKRADIKWFFVSGAAGFFLYNIAFNKGCETVTSATGSVIIAMTPIITALFASLIYKEHLRKVQWIAILICFAGVVILTVLDGGLSVNVGILWLLGASVLLSWYNLLQKQLTKRYSAVQSSAFSIFAGTILLSVFLPEAVHKAVAAPPIQIVYILILGIFPSAIAFISWAKAFAKAKQTSSVSNYMFVTPLLASILGVIIGHERIELSAIAGGTVIIAGLLLFNYGNKHKANS
jgi:drug/metabolite transporter (DMT)-like permease